MPDRHFNEHGLRVMTLNVAHGRGTSFHQLLLHSAEIVKNVDRIKNNCFDRRHRISLLFRRSMGLMVTAGGAISTTLNILSHSMFPRSIQASHV